MDDLTGVLQPTLDRVYALRERLQETLRQDFPSDTPELLGKLLLQLTEKVNDTLNELCEESPSLTVPEDRLTWSRRVRLCARTLRNLVPYLRYVEGARLEHNPWHIVGQFERLCRHIVPRARVIIRPKWKYNYSACWLNEDLRKQVMLVEHELQPVFNLFPNFFVLSYTSAESEDVLQCAIWGHEIGHLYSQEADARDPGIAKKFSKAISAAAPFTPKQIDELVDFQFYRRHGLDDDDLNSSEFQEIREKYRELLRAELSRIRSAWLSEIFADLFAIRIFGPAPVLAFFALPLTDDELDWSAPTHPAPRLRMAEMLKQLSRLGYGALLSENQSAPGRTVSRVEAEVKAGWRAWREKAEQIARDGATARRAGDLDTEEWQIKESILLDNLSRAISVVVQRVNQEIWGEYFCSPEGIQDVFRQVELLNQHLPPAVEANNAHCLGTILTAGWLYWNTYGKVSGDPSIDRRELFEARKRTNRLLSKAIEATTIQAAFEDRKKYAPARKTVRYQTGETKLRESATASGVLSAPDILARLKSSDPLRRVGVMPLLEEDQVQENSIDIRLGSTFLVTKRTTFPVIDVTASEEEFKERIEQYQQRIYVPVGRPLYIHPGQFVLASSLEFLSLPLDLAGLLVGRTSWGRLGISVPTTSTVAPGFKGCLTMEISNRGETPVPLYPGVRIAQLMLQTLSYPAPAYRGRYDVPTSTEFSRVCEDPEMRFLGQRRPPLLIGITGLSMSGRSRVVNYLREEGFFDLSLTAILRDEMKRSRGASSADSKEDSVDENRNYLQELRKTRGNDILARLLLQKLEATPYDRLVVEGIERCEEIDLFDARTRFFLIGITAPFENRLKWSLDYQDKPMTEEDLKKADRWELFGIRAEGSEAEENAPQIAECMNKCNVKIENKQGKSHLHQELKENLGQIMEPSYLYEPSMNW